MARFCSVGAKTGSCDCEEFKGRGHFQFNWININFIFIHDFGIWGCFVLFCFPFAPKGTSTTLSLSAQTISVRLIICVNELNCGPLSFLFYLVTHPRLVPQFYYPSKNSIWIQVNWWINSLKGHEAIIDKWHQEPIRGNWSGHGLMIDGDTNY